MDINTEYGAAVQGSSSLAVWEQRLARLVSGIFSPPLVAWARMRLKRHTQGQTIAGALVGAAFMLVVLCS
jgi:membrane-associated phospholipid phosphatase